MRTRYTGKDLTELMHLTAKRMIIDQNPDVVIGIESHFFGVELATPSCNFNLDMGHTVWLNRSRWSRLIREYLPLKSWELFKSQVWEIMDGKTREGATTQMMFREPERFAKKHRWGGCLMAATFRKRRDGGWQLTFYSRTTYIGYMAFLDAAIAHVMAREICDVYDNITLDDIGFNWHISDAQLHCFKTLPYLYSHLPDYLIPDDGSTGNEPDSPTLINIQKWQKKIETAYKEYGKDMLDYEKYGPFKRIKRRWMESQGYSKKNLPPKCTLEMLDFEKAE